MNIKNIPIELQNLNQWVCTKGDSKIPRVATKPFPASSTNPNTWSSFETAINAVANGTYDYLGFVFNDNGIVGIDIDDGYDEDGFLSDLAVDIIGRSKSYTEKSKSGRGFHILLKGALPFQGKNNLKGVEIYKSARYFIMTGETLLYTKIIENQEVIDYVIKEYFPEIRESENNFNGGTIYAPTWERSKGKINLRPNYPPIPDGARNISLTSLAGQWHNIGYTKDAIYKELLHVNQVACKPPLDIGEIQCIVNSVTRYRR